MNPSSSPRARRGLALGVLALATAALVPAGIAQAAGPRPGVRPPAFSYAVYGDAPYGTSPTDTSQTTATPAFVDAVNADPAVSAVLHVGDIHSGKQYCTQAYDVQVASMWARFADSLVYTPGDNEWADCHKIKEGGGTYNPATGQIDYLLAGGQPVDYAGGNPVDNLALVRSIFFPHPGKTLGSGSLAVLSQAQVDNSAHPTDGQYVENVLWRRQGVVFVTVNVPGGSNNDADPWYGAPSASPQQQTEAANRTAAAQRWLDRAFSLARRTDAQGVVVMAQADMWDLDGKPDSSHVANYEPVVAALATGTKAFGKPVLLLNGDSHVYRSDNPLAHAAPCAGDDSVCGYDAWLSHPAYDVPNFHRIVVHGSTTPLEYLRLRVTPGGNLPASASGFGPFSWTRVAG